MSDGGSARSARQTSLDEFGQLQAGPLSVSEGQLRFIETLDPLLDRATVDKVVTDIVIAPGAFDRRTIKGRLAKQDAVWWNLDLTTETDFVKTVLQTRAQSPEYLDRIDRLQLIETVLESDDRLSAAFQNVLGYAPLNAVEDVERVRSVVELLTNYHPERVAALKEWTPTNPGIAADLNDMLTGVQDLEAGIRARSERMASAEALLRRTTRQLRATDGALLTEAYPEANRLWVGGISTVSAPLVDLLAAVLQTTAIEVTIITRPASGSVIEERFTELLPDEGLGNEVINT